MIIKVGNRATFELRETTLNGATLGKAKKVMGVVERKGDNEWGLRLDNGKFLPYDKRYIHSIHQPPTITTILADAKQGFKDLIRLTKSIKDSQYIQTVKIGLNGLENRDTTQDIGLELDSFIDIEPKSEEKREDEKVRRDEGVERVAKPLKVYLNRDKTINLSDPKEVTAPHVAIVAQSGAGKTELLKSMLYQAMLAGTTLIILDTKGDYRDEYAQEHGLEVFMIGEDNPPLPFNPLVPEKGEGKLTTAYKFINILQTLGFIGENQYRELIEATKDYLSETSTPNVNGLIEAIEDRQREGEMKKGGSYMKTLGILRDFSIFPTAQISFNQYMDTVGKGVIIDAEHIEKTSKEVFSLVSTIVIESYANYFKSKGKSKVLAGGLREYRYMLVVDEASRVMKKYNSTLDDMLVTARSYGAIIVLSSQYEWQFKVKGAESHNYLSQFPTVMYGKGALEGLEIGEFYLSSIDEIVKTTPYYKLKEMRKS